MVLASAFDKITVIDDDADDYIPIIQDQTGTPLNKIITVQDFKKEFDGDIALIIDGGGSVITTGIKGVIQIDFDCIILQQTTLVDQTGSIVLDLWKDTFANYPATVADTITASAKPTISSGVKDQDSTLTGWTTTITAGDHIIFNVDSVSVCTRCTIALKVRRT